MGMKVRQIAAAKDAHGREEIKGSDENHLEKRKGSYKTTATGHESNSGSTNAELCKAAEGVYGKAVRNAGDSMGDHALQNR